MSGDTATLSLVENISDVIGINRFFLNFLSELGIAALEML